MSKQKQHHFLGSWIGAEMTVDERFAPIFMKSFALKEGLTEAKAYISGLGMFELKVNGSLPDDTLLNPANTQYTQTVPYLVFDVTPLLHTGENTVTAELGNGFFNENGGVWNWQIAAWRDTPRLLMDLVLTYADGTHETVSTDESWLVTSDGPIISNGIFEGEIYDARRHPDTFLWTNAVCVNAPKGALKLQDMPPIRKIAEMKPEKIERLSDGAYIVTSPEMTTGWAALMIEAPAGTEISVRYHEILDETGHVPKLGKGEGSCGEWWPDYYLQTDHYISDGAPAVYEPKFSYKGFKYIQIDNYPGELTTDDITIFRIANDVPLRGSFECSDEMVNQMHALFVRTLLNNFQGKPTDTPVWEKNGWLGDANCALVSMMYNFDMSSYLASFVDTMADCFHEYGDVPVMVPTADWSTENSPVWNTIFVFAAEKLIEHCGMQEYVKGLYPTLRAFARKDISDIRESGWIWTIPVLSDWLSPAGKEDSGTRPGDSEGSEICATGLIYGILRSMEKLALRFGFGEDADEYRISAEHIHEAFNRAFYRPDKGYYETNRWTPFCVRTKYRQTSNLIPLALGLVPQEHRKAVVENLINDIVRKDYHLDTGCTGTHFLLPVLFEEGYPEVAYRILTQTTYPSWGYWIKSGSDSAWEAWEPSTRSRDHYFLATFDEALFSHAAGIRHMHDGYRTFTVSPALTCGFEYVKCSIQVPGGLIRCEWKKNENLGYQVEIEIPTGSAAKISLSANGRIIEETVQHGIYHYTL